MAKIIILNGVSSAGKTTLAKALQEQSRRDLLHVAMDDFIGMLPDGSESREDWFPTLVTTSEGKPVASITSGPMGQLLLQAMRSFVGAAAQLGLDMVIDEVCIEDAIVDYRTNLAGHEMLIVKVYAALMVLEERESQRGDRTIGLAREQRAHLHNDIEYDFAVDTGQLSPDQAASEILKRLN